MLRKIKLYGELAKFVGYRVLEAEVRNAAEAVRFLIANFPRIEKHMSDQYYKVSAGDWQITTDELHYPTGQSDISIVPVVGGAGQGAKAIIIGIALITVAVLLPGMAPVLGAGGFTAAGGTAATGWAVAAAGLANIGAAMILYGIAQSLTPVPGVPEETQDPQNSFSFSGIQNTSRAGTPVPVIYGRILTGSVVISVGLDTNQVQT